MKFLLAALLLAAGLLGPCVHAQQDAAASKATPPSEPIAQVVLTEDEKDALATYRQERVTLTTDEIAFLAEYRKKEAADAAKEKMEHALKKEQDDKSSDAFWSWVWWVASWVWWAVKWLLLGVVVLLLLSFAYVFHDLRKQKKEETPEEKPDPLASLELERMALREALRDIAYTEDETVPEKIRDKARAVLEENPPVSAESETTQ